jgi:hypothetical protein
MSQLDQDSPLGIFGERHNGGAVETNLRTCALCNNKHLGKGSFCKSCREELRKKYGPEYDHLFLKQDSPATRYYSRPSLMEVATRRDLSFSPSSALLQEGPDRLLQEEIVQEDRGLSANNDFRSILEATSKTSSETISSNLRVTLWSAMKILFGVFSIALALGWAKYVAVGYVYLPAIPDYLDVTLGIVIGIFLLLDYIKDLLHKLAKE